MTAVCLLVEDDVVTRRIISNFLSLCSYEVIEASNGRIALEILESPQGDVVDIILTDNKMPEVRHAHQVLKDDLAPFLSPGETRRMLLVELQALHSTQTHLGLGAQVTGLELIVRLVQTKRWQHLPVVIMSSEMREDVVQQASVLSCVEFPWSRLLAQNCFCYRAINKICDIPARVSHGTSTGSIGCMTERRKFCHAGNGGWSVWIPAQARQAH